MTSLKASLKTLRASQPFNAVATSLVRTGYRTLNRKPGKLANQLRRVGMVRDTLPNGHHLKFFTRDDDSGITNEVFWQGWAGYEPETTPLFYRLAVRSRVTLDAGAHIGFHALLAAHANPQGQVYTFEPSPAVYQRLQQNVALNDVSNLHCISGALGEQDGTAEFFVHNEHEISDNSSLSRTNVQRSLQVLYETAAPQPMRCLQVPVFRIDSFTQNNQLECVDLIKLDVEGTEPEALRGMNDTLQRCKPHIICEVLNSFATGPVLEQILAPLGYRFYWLTDAGPILREQIEPQVGGQYQYRNYLFTTLAPDAVAQL